MISPLTPTQAQHMNRIAGHGYKRTTYAKTIKGVAEQLRRELAKDEAHKMMGSRND